MATQSTFIEDRIVDTIPAQKLQKPSDDEIARKEAERQRDPGGMKEGGAATRAGVATRDPNEFDTTHRGGQGNAQPQADPIPPMDTTTATPSSHKPGQTNTEKPHSPNQPTPDSQSNSTQAPKGPTATYQTFVGNKPVDSIPADKLQKPSDDEIARNEAERLRDPEGLKKGGAATRAGVATRDPKEFDTTNRGGQGNTQPQAEPIPPMDTTTATPSSHKSVQTNNKKPHVPNQSTPDSQSNSTQAPKGPTATYQTFIGSQPVDEIPSKKLQKPSDDEIARNEAERLRQPKESREGGAATRAGVATRDPEEFDTTRRGGQGNTQPQADPVI